MRTKSCRSKCMRALLLAASLSVGASLASAQGQSPGQGQQAAAPGQKVTVKDAAGREHVYYAPITDAHRKAVAKRMKAAIAKKGKGR